MVLARRIPIYLIHSFRAENFILGELNSMLTNHPRCDMMIFTFRNIPGKEHSMAIDFSQKNCGFVGG